MMNSMDWKVLLSATLAAFLLSACQHNSDDPASTPSSPYQGFWVSSQTTFELDQCRRAGGRGQQQIHPVDAIFIQGDGQVIRYTNRETHSSFEARKALRVGQVQPDGQFKRSGGVTTVGSYAGGYNYGSSMNDGVFGNFDGTRLILRDMYGSEQHSYTRTTENQLQQFQVEAIHCMGYGQRFAQMQPPDGIPPNYPVDPRIIRPTQPEGYRPPVQERPPMQQEPGNYPPPPELQGPGQQRQGQPQTQQLPPQPQQQFRQDAQEPWIQRPVAPQ